MQQSNQNIYDKLISTFKSNKFHTDVNNDVFIEKVIDDIIHQKPELIRMILSDEVLKKAFFQEVEGALIFKPKELIEALSAENKFLQSKTTYSQSIGLTRKDDFIVAHDDVVLAFPFKDTVFAGGQEKDDQKSKENFLHGIINANEVARLLEPKVMTNIKRYSKDGIETNPTITENDNLIIKGNNLLALHSLLDKADGTPLYRGKVKLIYIDPPYNTGNDSFNYNDNFSHSTWLTFMKNRLEVAREFLRDDGVIFVSIDDNEQAYLKVLMDEIFGRENFVALFPRITKKAGKTTDLIAKNTDYLLAYSKTNQIVLNKNKFEDKEYKWTDEFEHERGKYKLSQTLDYNTLGYVSSLDYPIEIDGDIYYPGGISEEEYKLRKKTNPKDDFRWRWSQDLFDFGYKNGFIVVKESKNGKRIYTKTYQNATIGKNSNGYFIEITERTKPTSTLEFTDNLYSNDNARKDLDKLFDEKNFDYPKPVGLLKKIISIATNQNDIIMDFHAGSGTTAHAVLDLNKQDGGSRKFILIEQMDYIQDITCKRVEKVIEKNAEGSFVYMELKKIDDFQESELLAKEMYYLPIEEIEDVQYEVSDEEKKVNFDFYGIDPKRGENG